MAVLLKHKAKVIRGAIVPDDIALAKSEINSLEGKRVFFFLTENDSQYDPSLMAYYRAGIIREASKYEVFRGWTEDEIHDWVKSELKIDSFARLSNPELKTAIEDAKNLFYKEHEIEFRDKDLYSEIDNKELT